MTSASSDPNAVIDKRLIRSEAIARRNHQRDRESLSAGMMTTLFSSSLIQMANVVACYISFRSEVCTDRLVGQLLAAPFSASTRHPKLVVPWCDGPELRLCRITMLADLDTGMYGLREPNAEVRRDPSRTVACESVDVFLVPGVAFDRSGGRLGYGKGYYDRLLATKRSDAVTIGLAFDCQIVEKIPVEPHDVPLDFLITESGLLRCSVIH